MTLAAIAGVGIGAALWLLWSGLAPAREPLPDALARLGNPDATPEAKADESTSLDARLGALLRRVPVVERLVEVIRADLRILRRDTDEQVAEIAAYAAVGLLWAPVVSVAGWWLFGITIPWLIPLWVSALGAAGAVVAGVQQVRQRAAEARTEFSYVAAAYCDVVAMMLSAGRELHTALLEGAAEGGGWAWQELRAALQHEFLMGAPLWGGLGRLGREVGVDDLVELAGTLALADDEGAAVADTVAGKAASLRDRLVGEAEQKAASATERMAIPGAAILIGFLGFIAFPAIYLILQEAA